ncbi:hydrogenase 4 subunit F [Burkholderia multivorans]|uniref:hydrogenase 4 subunit F n=1 Tax=Burkholderia multivorans TaxID=87883 RepID=UPI000CFE40F9|nr:hydrogenase 4 subunit F [Burkholderia multivorans]PRH18930.1 hydrogenase [Burkholderia multivorans]
MTGSSAHSWLIAALLLTYLGVGLLVFATRWLGAGARALAEALHVAGLVASLVLAVTIVVAILDGQPVFLFDKWLMVDPLSAIFVGLVALVGTLTGWYSLGYLRGDLAHGKIEEKRVPVYYGFFHLFLFTMTLACVSNNLVMMWVSIELTTLSSVFLVGFYGQRSSLEAAWKYIIICTVGVAFGLYGTVLVFANANAVMGNAQNAILWSEAVLHADRFDHATIAVAFVFVLIGFGTKAGLFPMHTWLPDAHSEAPSPVSGLLSAGLTSCVMLVIIRYTVIALRAVGPHLPHMLFLVFGVLSIGVAALLMFVQRDLKRLLAYSTVENMGIVALGLGIGGPFGVSAALLHVMNHGLAKALMFCGAGNAQQRYGTRDLDAIKGMLRVAPVSGFFLLAGALALGGMPPFNVFVSEFMTVAAGIRADDWGLMALCVVLLTIVLAAFARMIGGSVLGPAPERERRRDLGWLSLAPLFVTLVLMLWMGVATPRPVRTLIANASAIVAQATPAGTLASDVATPDAKANP